MKRMCVMLLSALAAFVLQANVYTEVMFFFDAEDYTSDRPNDALRDLANIFTEEGARVHVALVGYLAHELERYGRKDVIAALRPHVLGTQSMYHSKHPNVLELADGADYEAAYRRVREEEEEGVRIIRRVTGKDPIFAVPPGNSKSYVAMDVYADLGLRFYCDTVAETGVGGNWFANLRHFDYGESMECLIPTPGETPKPIDWKGLLDRVAARPRQILFLHPCMAVNRQFWDGVNYNGTNACEFGKWKLPQRRAEEDTQLYYARLRELIRRLKADGRFTFPTLEEKQAEESPRSAIRVSDVKRLASHMDRGIDAVESPSWSVADVFAASVKFLRGETVHEPGRVHGFLEHPLAIKRSVMLKASDIRAAARAIDLSGFLPASVDVGGARIGPGDFLRAALHVLADGGETVTVAPSDPLAALSRFERLRKFHPAGTWVFWPAFKDEYTSDRLRYQVWTWRPLQRNDAFHPSAPSL